MGRGYELNELIKVYDGHPLREETLLARLRKTHPSLQGLSEMDLAVDDRTQVTDQNHVGGVDLLRDLAESLRLTAASRVLDVGTGLGGASRVLASLHGCRVDGVDVSPSRCLASENLTRLVGLDDRVRGICGDILRVDILAGHYDVVLGLDTFAHFADKLALLERCHQLLKVGGLLAVHEVYIANPPRPGEQNRRLAELEDHWLAHFVTLEEWLILQEQCGLMPILQQDLTHYLVWHFLDLVRVSSDPPERELAAWRLAVKLGQSRTIGYVRTIAKRRS